MEEKKEKEKTLLDLLRSRVKEALAFPDIQERIKFLQASLDDLQSKKMEDRDFEEKLQRLIQLYEVNLSLSTYVGQDAVKLDLRPRIDTAKQQSRSLPHLLLCGPPEMGKVTLANAIAIETGKDIRLLASPIADLGDLSLALTSSDEGDFFLITNIERISGVILETLIEAVGEFQLSITKDHPHYTRLGNLQLYIQREAIRKREISGYRLSGRFIVALPRFTLVGTTSRPSQVDKRLHRWMKVYDFAPYTVNEISKILQLIAQQENLIIDPEAAVLLAERCEGSPGNGKVIVKRVRDYLSPNDGNHVTVDLATQALLSFGYLNKSSVSTDLATRLRNMDALEFEEFVANLFREMGYAVEMTQQSGDHGIDLLMRKGDQLIAVQCKHWDAPIGEPVIRDFLGSLTGVKANCGYVVASSTFTSKAFSFAQDKPIKLFDLDALMDLINRHKRDIP
jgi:Holliday junction resolvasome RuvABC ATP-dependent DNA helicase subunit